MKRRKQKTLNKKKCKKSYKCDACGSTFPIFKEYQKHVNDNFACKRILPYSCQFCQYVGYDQNGFQKHLHLKPSCEQFYKEKEVTTGMILDFSSGQVKSTLTKPNETSYHYNRFFASGEQDTVQLNLANNTIANMDYKSKLACLNKIMNTTTNTSVYISTSGIISSITNEIHPMDNSLQSNIANTINENT